MNSHSAAPEKPLRRTITFAPVFLGVGFSLLTFALYLWGPWQFPNSTKSALAAFVIFANAMMFLGFWFGLTFKSSGGVRPSILEVAKRARAGFPSALFRVVVVVSFLTVIPRMAIAGQVYDLDVSAYLGKVMWGLTDAFEIYKQPALAERPPGVWTPINQLCVATEFLTILFVPLVVLRWRQLSLAFRALAVGYMCLIASMSAARGRNVGVFELILQVISFVAIGHILRSQWHRTWPTNVWSRMGPVLHRLPTLGRGVPMVLVSLSGLVAMVAYFGNTMASRRGTNFAESVAVGGQWAYLDSDRPAWTLLPEALQQVWVNLTFYVAHGYEGLAQAMEFSYEPMFGFGGSFFLTDNLREVSGIDLSAQTYQYKLQVASGYDAASFWHTAYLWLANDVSLIGVPVLLFFIMAFYGYAWKAVLHTGNIFAALLMGHFVTFFAFISANHQLAMRAGSVFGIPFLILMWWWSGRLRTTSPTAELEKV